MRCLVVEPVEDRWWSQGRHRPASASGEIRPFAQPGRRLRLLECLEYRDDWQRTGMAMQLDKHYNVCSTA